MKSTEKTTRELWDEEGDRFGWKMPFAPWWKRAPFVRHLRSICNLIGVERWYSSGPGIMGLRSGYDDWVLFGMWFGWERKTRSLPITKPDSTEEA